MDSSTNTMPTRALNHSPSHMNHIQPHTPTHPYTRIHSLIDKHTYPFESSRPLALTWAHQSTPRWPVIHRLSPYVHKPLKTATTSLCFLSLLPSWKLKKLHQDCCAAPPSSSFWRSSHPMASLLPSATRILNNNFLKRVLSLARGLFWWDLRWEGQKGKDSSLET